MKRKKKVDREQELREVRDGGGGHMKSWRILQIFSTRVGIIIRLEKRATVLHYLAILEIALRLGIASLANI